MFNLGPITESESSRFQTSVSKPTFDAEEFTTSQRPLSSSDRVVASRASSGTQCLATSKAGLLLDSAWNLRQARLPLHLPSSPSQGLQTRGQFVRLPLLGHPILRHKLSFPSILKHLYCSDPKGRELVPPVGPRKHLQRRSNYTNLHFSNGTFDSSPWP